MDKVKVKTKGYSPWTSDMVSTQPRPADSVQPQVETVPEGMKSVSIPISSAEWPTLVIPVPMPDAAWDEMMAVLNAIKPGLTKKSSANGSQPEPLADDVDEDE